MQELVVSIFVLFSRTVNWVFIKNESGKSKSPLTLNFLLFILTLINGVLLILFIGFDKFTPTPFIILMIFLSAVFYVFGNGFRFIALKHMDISAISIIGQLSLVSGTFIPLLLGRSEFKNTLGIGILLIFIGNCILVYKNSIKETLKFDKYLMLAIISAFATGIAGIFYDYIRNDVPALTFFVSSIAFEIVILFFFKEINSKNISKEIEIHKSKLIWMGLFFSLSGISVALSIKYLGVVYSSIVMSLSLLLTVLVGIVFLKERENLFKKFIAGIVVIIGTYLTMIK